VTPAQLKAAFLRGGGTPPKAGKRDKLSPVKKKRAKKRK
jgi:hypothetical protein